MEGKANYAVDERSESMRQIEELKEALYRKERSVNLTSRSNENGPPDHLSTQGVINLLRNDMNQLHEELIELRSRLSPLLAERETLTRRDTAMPINCKIAAELYEIHTVVQNSRQIVEITLLQLDL